MTEAYQREKHRIRQNFDAAAGEYDTVAELQRTVAGHLLEQLELIRLTPAVTLDLGSGTGFVGRKVSTIFTRSRVLQLDYALNMLRQARRHDRRFFSRHTFICADAEDLPLPDQSVDLIISNLMLQWIASPGELMRECGRVLRPGGLFLFSSFGPDTLQELRESWRAVDAHVHVNAFVDMHDLGQDLIRAGFEQPVLQTERFTLLYDDVHALMRELKALGAANVNRGRRKTLTTAAMFARLAAAYDRDFPGPRLPATFEVVYGHAWWPSQAGVPMAGSPVAIPVTAIGRRQKP